MKYIKKTLLLSIAVVILTAINAQAQRDSTEAKNIYANEMAQAGVKTKKTSRSKYAGWYMRTKVYATTEEGKEYSHTTAGIFGKLKQSKWKKDQHDIPAFSSATFQVVFPHYNWGEESGDYLSNYYKWTKHGKNKRAVWTFQVKNQSGADLSNAELRIVLEGAQNVRFTKKNGIVKYSEAQLNPAKKNRLTLVDVDNHQTYSVDELEYANLSMDGKHTRTFRWVMGRVKKRDFKPLPQPE